MWFGTTATTSPIARPPSERRDPRHAVVIGQLFDHHVRVGLDLAEARQPVRAVLGQCLGPCVEDETIPGRRHDRGRDDGRRLVGLHRAENDLLAITEDVGPGPDLVDAPVAGQQPRRRRAGADRLDLEAIRLERLGRGLERADLVERGRAGAPRRVAVTGVGEDAFDVKPGTLRHASHRHRGLRVGYARPVEPGVDLDEHPQPLAHALHGGSQPLGPCGGVHPDPQVRRPVERAHAFRLRSLGPHGVGDEDVAQAGEGEHLRLPERADGQAGRARLDLQPPDSDALVRLGVRPEPDAALVQRALEAEDVGVQAVPIDDELRGVDAGGQDAVAHGRATIGDRSSPNRSIRSTTSSPGSR